DGNPGGDLHFDFHRYFGDSDGDRDVDFADTFAYQKTHFKIASDSGYDETFDWDLDGDIDALDLFQFRKRYLTKLAPKPSPATLAAADPELSAEATAPETDEQRESTSAEEPSLTEEPNITGRRELFQSRLSDATTAAAQPTWQDPWAYPCDRNFGFGFDDTTAGEREDRDDTLETQDSDAGGLLLAASGVLDSN
ncbi:MAG: hypothetical protein KDN22_32090, partial [Verrucomicrobiae bacterium]|nr:hypothetical protein [Verrucomicrobiae bacterium]